MMYTNNTNNTTLTKNSENIITINYYQNTTFRMTLK